MNKIYLYVLQNIQLFLQIFFQITLCIYMWGMGVHTCNPHTFKMSKSCRLAWAT